jgi:hypothetical protein
VKVLKPEMQVLSDYLRENRLKLTLHREPCPQTVAPANAYIIDLMRNSGEAPLILLRSERH